MLRFCVLLCAFVVKKYTLSCVIKRNMVNYPAKAYLNSFSANHSNVVGVVTSGVRL